ncbi:ATP-dependent DNA helicase RecG [Marmoricola endophyticus]|uniref:ATP-dependent DNA helicase RecG n=1 Tax=Marmoricola endophyticus TaxID=2040280 RepID=A0A917F0U1_9ACTN|nr:ATP-dependent DNA helicase RecG [Marmoricola endophyticus]GGF39165.1 ATP-dependent DNA helicase RecG [Marmoricola endophyticus]
MPERITWQAPIASVAGKDAAKVEKALGLHTVGDLLLHYPRSYVAKGTLSDLSDLSQGDFISIFGQVTRCDLKPYTDRRTHREAYRVLVTVKGSDGALAMTFFDRKRSVATWRLEEYAIGSYGLFSGKLNWFNGQWELTNPRSKTFKAEGDASAAYDDVPDLVPIYPAAGNVDTWHVQDAVALALDLVDHVPDPLPDGLRERLGLLDARGALRRIHRPADHRELGAARKRLKLDEAFVTQVTLALRRRESAERTTTARPALPGGLLERFDERLPFTLTDGQRQVSDTLLDDLAGSHPMHRLLQGEVGSGKTVVALRAMLRVVDAGGQAVLLAPTEVLAQQHARSVTALLGDLALDEMSRGGLLGSEDGTRVALLTGSMRTGQRRQAMLDAASGEAGIVIGTHALLEDEVSFADLGLVVVDEQHRFGVEQRAALGAKSARPPHVLVMTATPIPRTVAMTVFGDLDTLVLSELPKGRGEVQTTLVPRANPAWLDRAWERVREEVAAGRQAYVVCPRIGDELPAEDDVELASVEEQAELLAVGPLSGLRVERMHGRMPADAKDAVMTAFAAGEIDVLVSTTVIEVGVDVPNATVMVILDAERFGVSQLHQLRGRIGRGGHAGLCLLVTGADPGSTSLERLSAVAATRDGFELSEVDLRLRREGDVLGADQSGRRRTLRLLSVLDDADVIVQARELAEELVATDPELATAPDLRAEVGALEESSRADFLGKT